MCALCSWSDRESSGPGSATLGRSLSTPSEDGGCWTSEAPISHSKKKKEEGAQRDKLVSVYFFILLWENRTSFDQMLIGLANVGDFQGKFSLPRRMTKNDSKKPKGSNLP